MTQDRETTDVAAHTSQPVGLFYSWWRGDPLPSLESLEGFSVRQTDARELLAWLAELDEAEIARRIEEGHRPYLACIGDEPVAYGWSAWERGEIGELGLHFELPEGSRYLWDFVTLPDWRGYGIYPRMIQAIIQRERDAAERFWIGHDLDNEASARGITKAGLPVVGEVWIRDGKPIFVSRDYDDRASAAGKILDLPVITEDDRSQL